MMSGLLTFKLDLKFKKQFVQQISSNCVQFRVRHYVVRCKLLL
jgi:hypothetical protein